MTFWIKYSLFIILFYYSECENGHDSSQRNLTGIGVCYTTRNGINETFCCQNYEKKGNKCKKCKTGNISPKGGNKCIPCSNGWYGMYCSRRCACSINPCDHIVGCVSDVNGTTYSGTIVANNTIEHETTLFESTTYSELTTYTVNGDIPTHEQDDEKGYISNLAIYVTCTGGLVIAIGCFMFWHKRRRKCCEIERVKPTTDNIPADTNELHITRVPRQRISSDSMYDEIGDINSSSDNPSQNNLNDDNDTAPPLPIRPETMYDEVDEQDFISAGPNIHLQYQLNDEYSVPLPLRRTSSYMEQEPESFFQRQEVKRNVQPNRLHIEKGRYQGTPRHERYCLRCNTNDIDDEKHFLLSCSHLKEERDSLNDIIAESCIHFQNLDNDQKLMTNDE